MALVLGFLTPIYLLARILFLPIEKPIDIFIKNKIKDPLFNNSLRMALWTFLVPIVHGLFMISLHEQFRPHLITRDLEYRERDLAFPVFNYFFTIENKDFFYVRQCDLAQRAIRRKIRNEIC
jgi:hypothetical protein